MAQSSWLTLALKSAHGIYTGHLVSHRKKSNFTGFSRQIGRKIGRSCRKFRGKLRRETISKNQPLALEFFGQILLKSISVALIWPALLTFLTEVIICSFNNALEKWANVWVISMALLSLRCTHLSRKTSLVAWREEQQLYLQPNKRPHDMWFNFCKGQSCVSYHYM